MAIARATQSRIRIITADDEDVVIEEKNPKEVVLCFHKLLYANGEHYNSIE